MYGSPTLLSNTTHVKLYGFHTANQYINWNVLFIFFSSIDHNSHRVQILLFWMYFAIFFGINWICRKIWKSFVGVGEATTICRGGWGSHPPLKIFFQIYLENLINWKNIAKHIKKWNLYPKAIVTYRTRKNMTTIF
jgi:hypothetical protein